MTRPERGLAPGSRPIPAIRPLDGAAISRIAAGEVVERPASVVKELIENALDAGSTRIEVAVADGGRTLARVADDGHGIPASDLPLALARHATSKTDGSDLQAVATFGFRGEALASLAAVARVSVTSRVAGQGDVRGAFAVAAEGGEAGPVRPAALSRGTVVEVRDLFFATPARLKFLRGDRAEAQAVADVVRRLALAAPGVAFALRDLSDGGDRLVFRAEAEEGDLLDGLLARAARVLGRDFAASAVPLDAHRDGHALRGYAGLPADARGAAVAQHLFVNGRPVRDKLLAGALRAAYGDAVAPGRHPAAVLLLDCLPALVDANVHPAKAEVRFRDAALVRGLLVVGVRAALAGAGVRASAALGGAVLDAFRPAAPPPAAPLPTWPAPPDRHPGLGFAEASAPAFAPGPRREPEGAARDRPLGAARAQLHGLWIVAETADGIVLVDQHAAHERLVYERLKREADGAGVAVQPLLVPEVVELGEGEAERLLAVAGDLAALGLGVEPFGPGAVLLREVPAALGQVDAKALLGDVLDGLETDGTTASLARRRDAVLARVACHGSVRAGRQLRPEEMDALLREMEGTPAAGTCNHGRPTFVELRLSDIERLFGRR